MKECKECIFMIGCRKFFMIFVVKLSPDLSINIEAFIMRLRTAKVCQTNQSCNQVTFLQMKDLSRNASQTWHLHIHFIGGRRVVCFWSSSQNWGWGQQQKQGYSKEAILPVYHGRICIGYYLM